MSLSETSYEILSDLLELRLESFLVTSNEEARELKMLKHCQRELSHLQNMANTLAQNTGMPAPTVTAEQSASAAKLPRRLQRLIQEEAKRAG